MPISDKALSSQQGRKLWKQGKLSGHEIELAFSSKAAKIDKKGNNKLYGRGSTHFLIISGLHFEQNVMWNENALDLCSLF